MKKRLMAILLSLCMVLSLTPAVAFAGENTSMLNGTQLTQELLAKCEKQEDEHSLFSRMVYKLDGGSYYLTGNVSLAYPLFISEGDVTLDLNGHVLDLKGQFIYVENNNLNLTDSNTENLTHKFRVEDTGLWVWDETKGAETLKGGVITGGSITANSSGGGVYVSSNSTFTMSDNAVHADGTFNDRSKNGIPKNLLTGINAGIAGTAGSAVLAKAAKALADAVNPVVRSKETTKGNVCLTLSLNAGTKAAIRKLEAQGCTVKYRFYRSTNKSKDYKLTVTKSEPTYLNTVGKNGTMYYYKAILLLYDQEGKLLAKSELKQCRYANRIWK